MNPGAGGSSLLVIGGAKTGKTHYAGQLLRRLEAKKHLLKMAIAASDRTPLQEVLEKLAVGRSASHTPNNIYRESVWDVWIDGSPDQSQLIWPDYGGEQIEDIVRKRQITEPWIQRVRDSGGLLFFVRPSLIGLPEDVLNRPRNKVHMQSAVVEAAEEQNAVPDAPEPSTRPSGQPEVDAAQSPVLRTEAALIEIGRAHV